MGLKVASKPNLLQKEVYYEFKIKVLEESQVSPLKSKVPVKISKTLMQRSLFSPSSSPISCRDRPGVIRKNLH